jgi:hypothetical protein
MKIKMIRHIEVVYEPDEIIHSGMTPEEIAVEDARILAEFESHFFLGKDETREIVETITWEIVEDKVITDGEHDTDTV